MDRVLLERMVGAVVLVLLFVVFVPSLLDGPEGDDAESITEAADGNRTEVIVLNAPRSVSPPPPETVPEAELGEPMPLPEEPAKRPDPEPAERVEQEAEPEPEPRPEPLPEPEPKPAAQPKPESTPQPVSAPQSKPVVAAPREGFAVQVGSFGSRDNAAGFAATIQESGYKVFVIRGAVNGRAVYRVYAGPEKTRPDAEKLAGKLAADGRSVMVVDLGSRAND
jgi:cell division septation protein DedD